MLMFKNFKIGDRIEYMDRIYEYNRNEHGFLIFKQVDNSDNEIKFHCTTIENREFDDFY